MIRANHLPTGPTQQIVTLHYRNAVYQGEYESNSQTLAKNGLLYFHENRHFIGCKQFFNNELNGSSFCIYDSQNYQYGSWNQNKPCGISVFHLKDVLVVASYQNGVILQGSKIVVILQAYNIGVVLQYSFGGNWLILQKNQVYCDEQIQRLLLKCKFNSHEVYQSLLKFINNKLNSKQNKTKLRYIDSSYRFGFQNGLAVCFNELERIICFQTSDGKQQYTGLSSRKIGQVYNKNTMKQIKFKNKMFQDPSKSYFDNMKQIINEKLIKSILSGFIKDHSIYLQKSRYIQAQFYPIKISKIQKSKRQTNILPSTPAKNIQQSIIIGQSLSQSSTMKEQFFKSRLKQFQNQQISPERENAKRYLQQIDRIGMLLNKPKQNVKRLNLLSQSQIIKIVEQTQPPSSYQLIQQHQYPIIQPFQQQKINYQVQTNSIQIDKEKENKQKQMKKQKEKKKIFDQAPNNYEFSPSSQKKQFHNKNRLKIFSPNENKTQKQLIQDKIKNESEQINNKQIPQDLLSSPIHRLNSDAFKISKQQFLIHNTSEPNIIHLNTGSEKNPKKSLTEFQSESSSIIIEDMSNLQQLAINKSLQVNDSPLKKLKKLNQIYKITDKDAETQPSKGKVYGNQPYLQKDLINHNRRTINSMYTKSKADRYQNQ